MFSSILLFVLGLLVLVFGIVLTVLRADILVRGAVSLATIFGVSPTTIGLTIVAMGTFTPELVATIISTVRGDASLAWKGRWG
jgi:cation:H+ antiporter